MRFARPVRDAVEIVPFVDLLAGLAAMRLTEPRALRLSGALLATSDGRGVLPL